MDFFDQQERARRNTWLLLALLIPAGAVVAAGVVLAVLATFAAVALTGREWWRYAFLMSPGFVGAGTVFVLGLMALASWRKFNELTFAGPYLASFVGGCKVPADTTEQRERVLRNVVEEMALAAGMPVPDIYVLDSEPGINAFCAGNAPVRVGDTALAVTRGCLAHLERDELQAVVAHEFSHMLSGDMRLNVRLVGFLHGIECLGQSGRVMLGVPNLMSWVAGPILVVVGGIGLLLGKLVRASVCRQREVLADAAAVQFTRNPEALASALKKIVQAPGSSVLRHRNAAILSHMYFSLGVGVTWQRLFATHPPMNERIRALDSQWQDVVHETDRPLLDRIADQEAKGPTPYESILPKPDVTPPDRLGEQLRHACASAGRPRQAHLNRARGILGGLPAGMLAAARQAQPARAVVLALLLSPDPASRQSQMAGLAARGDAGLARLVEKLAREAESQGPEARIPLLELSVPTLKGLAASQYQDFRKLVQRLAMVDGRLEVYEWMLAKMLLRHLDPHFGLARPGPGRQRTLAGQRDQAAAVLSCLAWAGSRNLGEAREAFNRGAPHLGLKGLILCNREDCGLPVLDKALAALEGLAFGDRSKVLDACAVAAESDGRVTVREAELVHGVADALGCPLPLLIPS